MSEFSFEGIGTPWTILSDRPLTDALRSAIIEYVEQFNARFSRFLEDTEATRFRNAKASMYTVPADMARLLSRARAMRELSGGAFDPAVGALLEDSGFGGVPARTGSRRAVPNWTIEGTELTIDGPIIFDFGGIGKGYCIDRVADLLKAHGHEGFLVDGGGDMYGTEKSGEAWNVALEYPGKPDLALGQIKLAYAGLAVSDIFRRQSGTQHHIFDARAKEPVRGIIGAIALADDAWSADCATSLLFLSEDATAAIYLDKTLVMKSDGTACLGKGWVGELFL